MVNMLKRIVVHTLLFLSVCTGLLSHPTDWLELDYDINYYDLIKLGVTCGDLHSCLLREDDTDYKQYLNSCHCGPACAQMGTCCVDSKYRKPLADNAEKTFRCWNHEGDELFQIVGCRDDWDGDDFVKNLCRADAETLNDPFLTIPVSSRETGITFRNYFCFVCNVDTDVESPFFWNFRLWIFGTNVSGNSPPDLIFNKARGIWTTRDNHDVDFEILKPSETYYRLCRPGRTIETCADEWTDVLTKKNCEAYKAVIWAKAYDTNYKYYTTNRYQNPHCAICNFADLFNSMCDALEGRTKEYPHKSIGYSGVLFVGLFSLNSRTIRCPTNTILDTFKNKCRAFRCGRGFVMVDGECQVKGL